MTEFLIPFLNENFRFNRKPFMVYDGRTPLENHFSTKYSRSGRTSQRGQGRAPGYRKLALPGLKSVDFFGLKMISLGHHVFRSVTLSNQKYNPIRPARGL